MAFPGSEGLIQEDIDDAWRMARKTAKNVKDRAASLRALSLAGVVGSSVILDFVTFLADAKLLLLAKAGTPGIVEHARVMINNPTIDIVLEFNNMVLALDAVVAWVIAAFPTNTGAGDGGFLLANTFIASGRTVDRTFDTASLAGLRTALDSLIASIS